MTEYDIYIENEQNAQRQYVLLRSKEHAQIVLNICEARGFDLRLLKHNVLGLNLRWIAIDTPEVGDFINCLEATGLSYEIIDDVPGDWGLGMLLYYCGFKGESFDD